MIKWIGFVNWKKVLLEKKSTLGFFEKKVYVYVYVCICLQTSLQKNI